VPHSVPLKCRCLPILFVGRYVGRNSPLAHLPQDYFF